MNEPAIAFACGVQDVTAACRKVRTGHAVAVPTIVQVKGRPSRFYLPSIQYFESGGIFYLPTGRNLPESSKSVLICLSLARKVRKESSWLQEDMRAGDNTSVMQWQERVYCYNYFYGNLLFLDLLTAEQIVSRSDNDRFVRCFMVLLFHGKHQGCDTHCWNMRAPSQLHPFHTSAG